MEMGFTVHDPIRDFHIEKSNLIQQNPSLYFLILLPIYRLTKLITYLYNCGTKHKSKIKEIILKISKQD